MYEHISILKDEGRVVKKTRPDTAALEVELSQAAYNISQRSGRFITPRIIDSDVRQGIIVYEYLSGIRPLFELKQTPDKFKILVGRAANCLRDIHRMVRISDLSSIRFPEVPPDISDRKSFLHGDFNLENVQYDERNDRLVILDWSLTPLLESGRGNYGPVEWDVAWFLRSLFLTRPYHIRDLSLRRAAATLFVQAYFQGERTDHKCFVAFLSLCYDFSTPKLNPRISWHLYLRQWLCRTAFRNYISDVSKFIHDDTAG